MPDWRLDDSDDEVAEEESLADTKGDGDEQEMSLESPADADGSLADTEADITAVEEEAAEGV